MFASGMLKSSKPEPTVVRADLRSTETEVPALNDAPTAISPTKAKATRRLPTPRPTDAEDGFRARTPPFAPQNPANNFGSMAGGDASASNGARAQSPLAGNDAEPTVEPESSNSQSLEDAVLKSIVANASGHPAGQQAFAYALQPDMTYEYDFELTSGDDRKGPWHLTGNVSYDLEPKRDRPPPSVMERARGIKQDVASTGIRIRFLGFPHPPLSVPALHHGPRWAAACCQCLGRERDWPSNRRLAIQRWLMPSMGWFFNRCRKLAIANGSPTSSPSWPTSKPARFMLPRSR